MPVAPTGGNYADDAYRELERRSGKAKKRQLRSATEGMAGQGRLSSGAVLRERARAEEAGNEMIHQGSQQIEDRRFTASEAEKGREGQMKLEQQKADNMSRLQAQGYSENEALLLTQQQFAGQQAEINRQFDYGSMLSGQQHELTTLDAQGGWQTYLAQGEYGHEAGMFGMQGQLQMDTLGQQQYFASLMSEFGVDVATLEYQWQRQRDEFNYQASKKLGQIANDAGGGLGSVVGAIFGTAAGAIIGGWGGAVGAGLAGGT